MFYTKKIHCPIIALFMSAVLVFNFVSANFHEIQEHLTIHSENQCSEENEVDACHRFIIHHEKSEGCDGSHQHLNSKHEECFACKYTKDRQNDIFIGDDHLISSLSDELVSDLRSSHAFSSTLSYIRLRGPPAVS